jgi:ABC-type branched-subunit amino acid transport system substrate-binding protein
MWQGQILFRSQWRMVVVIAEEAGRAAGSIMPAKRPALGGRLKSPSLLAVFLVSALPAAAEKGVTAGEVVLGEASAFSGPSAGLGVEQWRGHSAAFQATNDAGGVHGRKIRLVVTDDGYDAEKAAPAVVELITKYDVFAVFGGVGTPTIVKALPVILRYHNSEGLFRFANFTGAQPQREPPYDKAVFNVRASYRQETKAMADAFVAKGLKKIGIYVQDDAYGTSGRDGIRRALKDHGLEIARETTYPRGQTYDVSTAGQLKILRDAGVDAVMMVGAYQACAALVRDARAAGWNVPLHNVSFVGADQMLRLLRDEEKKTGKKLTDNLIVTQVVPSYNDRKIPLVRDYAAAIDKYNPRLPQGVGDGSYVPASSYSFGSLEGYLNARVFLAVLEKTGKDLTRKSFYDAAERMGKFDVGLGVPLELSPARHQALDKVWFTYVSADGWASRDDPSSLFH